MHSSHHNLWFVVHSSSCVALISDTVEVSHFVIFFCSLDRLVLSPKCNQSQMDRAHLVSCVCHARNSGWALAFCTSQVIFWEDVRDIKNIAIISFRSLRIRESCILTLCHCPPVSTRIQILTHRSACVLTGHLHPIARACCRTCGLFLPAKERLCAFHTPQK
jgi:hypothetical protein